MKCTLSREESFRIHAKRHPITLEYRAGCDADGGLPRVHVRGIGDSGAYASVGMKVLERAAGHASGAVPLAGGRRRDDRRAHQQPVCGAFRGFGANQAQFAIEGVLDRLAEMVGISGWEIRKRNVIRSGDTWGPGQVMDDGADGAEACLDAIRPEYESAIAAGKAVGLGLGLKNSGSATASARSAVRSCGSARPTTASRSATAGPRWARACTPSRSRSRPRSWASTRPAST